MQIPQANSKLCFVCGLANAYGLKLRFYTTSPDEVTANYTVPDQFQGFPGIVHGGIVAAMLDEAAGRSLMEGEQTRFMFTARLDIRYRKNVPVNQPLRLVGQVIKKKSRTASAHSALYDQAGVLLAEADVLLVDVPQEVFSGVNLAELGWKVYPEGEIDQHDH